MPNRAPPNAATTPESNAVGMVFHHIELNATPHSGRETLLGCATLSWAIMVTFYLECNFRLKRFCLETARTCKDFLRGGCRDEGERRRINRREPAVAACGRSMWTGAVNRRNVSIGSNCDLQHPLKHRRLSARNETFGAECRCSISFDENHYSQQVNPLIAKAREGGGPAGSVASRQGDSRAEGSELIEPTSEPK